MKNKLFEGRDGMRKMMEIASGKQRVDEFCESDLEEGLRDYIRGKNYDRLARRSGRRAIDAMDKASDYEFADLDNREEHENEFMRQMAIGREREQRADKLLGRDDPDDILNALGAWADEHQLVLGKYGDEIERRAREISAKYPKVDSEMRKSWGSQDVMMDSYRGNLRESQSDDRVGIVLDLMKQSPNHQDHPWLDDHTGEWTATSEFLVGSFAGRGFDGETPESAVSQVVDYFDQNLSHYGLVGQVLRKSGWPNLGRFSDYVLHKYQESSEESTEESEDLVTEHVTGLDEARNDRPGRPSINGAG